MSRAMLIIKDDRDRAHARYWLNKAKAGTRVEFKGPRRTLDQNSRFWAMLTDIAMQLAWHGERLTTGEWKLLFLDALTRESRTIPSLDGRGVVDVGRSSSDLSVEEMRDCIELMFAFGAEHGVKWSDPKDKAA